MEIVPGGKAREKPEPAFGYWKFGTPCCVVAGDHHDCQRTSLHELGHCLNFLLQFPSRSERWLKIWGADRQAGRVPNYADQRTKPEEYLCESFANVQTGGDTTAAVRDFINRLA